MFSGIVHQLYPVVFVEQRDTLVHFGVELCDHLIAGVTIGASIAIDGVCQTVVKIDHTTVFFDAIEETLNRTTLNELTLGRKVNVERTLKVGDDIGGHQMSGHVYGTVEITAIEKNRFTFSCASDWMKTILEKGFIGLDGCSLTVVDPDPSGYFSVCLIPETLSRTTFGSKQIGDKVNLEFDFQTQTIVSTVERLHHLKVFS